MDNREYLFHNLYFFNDQELVQASMLVREGEIHRFGKEPVLESLPAKYERYTYDAEGGYLLPTIKDQCSYLDGYRTDKEISRLMTKMRRGGIEKTVFYFSDMPSRVGWLEKARKINKLAPNCIIAGPEEYIQRWDNLDLGPMRAMEYYPTGTKFITLYGEYNPNEDQLWMSVDEEKNLISKLQDHIIVGSTGIVTQNSIPFACSLLFDKKHSISRSIPMRHPQLRKSLISQFRGWIAVGHGKLLHGKAGYPLYDYIYPILFELRKKSPYVYPNVTTGDDSFVILKKNSQPLELPKDMDHLKNPRYQLSFVYVDNEMYTII